MKDFFSDDEIQTELKFDGPAYDHKVDGSRLAKQHERIKNTMLDGQWRTLQEIAEVTGDPPASVSAQLRHLRKPRFGSWIVEKRHRGDRSRGLFEYRLLSHEQYELASGGVY